MIETKELRVGNWIATEHIWHQVVEIRKDSVVIDRVPMNNLRRADESREFRQLNTGSVAHDFDELHPIPLTPKLLEKCGFKESPIHDGDGNEMDYFYYHASDFVLKEEQEQNTFKFYFQDGPKKVYIKYLHQLQNLYFALTGQELKINL